MVLGLFQVIRPYPSSLSLVLIINTFSFQFLLYYSELSCPYFQYTYLNSQNMSQIAQLFLPLPLNPTLDVKASEFF